MDVIHDFALPLPLMVIAEMLGIPEDERGQVYEIAEKLLVGPRVAPGRMREIADAMRAMDRYATPLVEERSDRPGHDLISVLAGGEQQGVYTRDQVLQNIAFLVVAGHETTHQPDLQRAARLHPPSRPVGPVARATPSGWPGRPPRSACATTRR